MAISPNQAILALQNFQRLFGALLELTPKLETISTLEEYEVSLAATVEQLKQSVINLKTDVSNEANRVEEQKKLAISVIEEANAKAAEILKKAEADAEATRTDARAALSAEITALSAQKQKRAKEVELLEARSAEISNKINSQEAALATLSNAIAEIKAKL